MDKQIQTILKDIYSAPRPERRDACIRLYQKRMGYQKMNTLYVLRTQIAYIRKPVWLITFAVFAAAVVGLKTNYSNTVFLVSAMMPFVSGLATLESFRSFGYGMNELEQATRFSLKGILFARIAIIGSFHIIVLFSLVFMISRVLPWSYFMTGAVITIPYLVSSIISMEIERTKYGRNHAYASIVVSALVSAAVVVVSMMERRIFSSMYYVFWIMALFILFGIVIMEYRKMYRTAWTLI